MKISIYFITDSSPSCGTFSFGKKNNKPKGKNILFKIVQYQNLILKNFKMKNLILITTLALFSFSSCKPNKPKPTNPNGNFLSCKVNGVDWSADVSSGLGDYPLTAKLLFNSTYLSIGAINSNNETIDLGLYEMSNVKKQSYNLTVNAPNSYTSHAQFDNNLATNQYQTDSINTGIATITNLDKTNNLVEGTFSFKAYNKVLVSIVEVTDGKFSINYTNH